MLVKILNRNRKGILRSSSLSRRSHSTASTHPEGSDIVRHSPAHNPRRTRSEWGSRRNRREQDRKSTRLNSSHMSISYAVFCLKKKKKKYIVFYFKKKKKKQKQKQNQINIR